MNIEAIVLGRAQDGGVPQAGCECTQCAAARRGSSPREYAACLALMDQAARSAWLIDAGPDFREQLALLQEARPGVELRGIFITHAHVGHYAGLIHLGREAMNAAGMPVHATARVCSFLRGNGPWSQLVSLGNIALRPLVPEAPIALSENLKIEAIRVPHRAEYSDTCAFVVRGESRSLFYCPDIDAWESWDRDVRDLPNRYAIALIDGTFFDAAELPERDLAEVPHPTVLHTIELMRDGRGRVLFTHLNHTNPLLGSAELRDSIRAKGFALAEQGAAFAL